MSTEAQFPGTFQGLLQLVGRLRAPDGCPWDREQTRESLTNLLVQECYELVDAIEKNDSQMVVEELGDVLFHLVLQVQMGKETGEFDEGQVFESLVSKLVRRHPHVFGDSQVTDSSQVKDNWDALKRQEKAGTGASILDGVPRQMPALAYAQEIQDRAGRAAFDWNDLQGVKDKVLEELEELESAASDSERENELGDVLFSLVNVARWLGIEAERSLRGTNARFYKRYATMERLCLERGIAFPDLSLDQKEALWQEAKRLEGRENRGVQRGEGPLAGV